MSVKKKLFFFYVAIISLFMFAQLSYACHDCGKQKTYDPNLAANGCNNLHVKIHNSTQYTFQVDTSGSYPDSNPAYGKIGSNTAVSAFPAISGGGGADFYITGTENLSTGNQDDVDRQVRYFAYMNGKKTGAYFTVHFQKDSCNAYLTKCETTTESCFDQDNLCTCWWNFKCTCEWCIPVLGCIPNMPCGNKGYNPKHCDQTQSPALSSSSIATPALPGGIFVTGIIQQNATFSCSVSTVCKGSSVGNTAALFEFTINASPIETLTITFPFNPQSPLGKLMKDIVYNNINPVYIEKLGLYYSMTPITLSTTKSEMAFSTLCNAASCLQP